MSYQAVKKVLLYLWVLFGIASVVFFFVGGEQLNYVSVDTGDVALSTNDIGELTTGRIIEQPFQIDGTQLTRISLSGSNYGRPVGGILTISILDQGQEERYSREIDMGLFNSESTISIAIDPALIVEKGSGLRLRLVVKDGSQGSVPTLYYGSSLSLARGQVDIGLQEDQKLWVDGGPVDGVLCFQIIGARALWFGACYWYLVAALALLLLLFSVRTLMECRKGNKTWFLSGLGTFYRYRFLLEQLISRDFKNKYKRSILGVLWSFLNPMLMMTVQYIVFSTIFKSDIENFAVYLLTGIVCFNFFSEATSMSITSIVGNASLITKVYLPKYIYPVSRTMSSMINFLLSLLPLFLVVLVTQARITPAILLLPFPIMCLFFLALGVGMMLSASMVFFRDTQFLWNVLSLMWMYMTPIFYPEDIVSGWLGYVFKLNPLYHVIRFFRIIILNGISPEPKAYLLCLLTTIVPLLLGWWWFRKKENEFVLYI